MRAYRILSVLLLPLLLLSGCSTSNNSPQEAGIKVYTSFYAMYDFARIIGGDKAQITNAVPAGSEPHDWEPKASDMAEISECDLFIYHGSGMDDWAKDISTLSESAKIVEASDGIPELGGDPHMWLDPQLAMIEIENICAGFELADPENADYYRANLADALSRLKTLDSSFQTRLSACPKKDIVVSHQAYGYLCDAYGLTQVSISGLQGEGDASPSRIAEIVELMKTNNIGYVFFEPLKNSDITAPIVRETGAETLELDPFEGNTEDEDYFTVMGRNLDNLELALK